MSKGMNFYKKNKVYTLLRKTLSNHYSPQKVHNIYEYAGNELDKLLSQYSGIPKGEHFHTDKFIFPKIAMYRALLNELNKEESLQMLENVTRIQAMKQGHKLGKITTIPGMKTIFIKMFGKGAKTMFGERAGFKQHFYPSQKGRLKFDILQCPYCKYFDLCGCPELTYMSCDSDIYSYGNLTGIEFTRAQTLGRGGDLCDFNLELIKKNKKTL